MEDKEILSALKKLCDYAYEQGYHEMGYDPVREIARKLKEARRNATKTRGRAEP